MSRLWWKKKEDLSLSGPHDRADIKKKKKKETFSFREPVNEWFSLEEAKILHFDHSSSFVGSITYEKATKEMLGVLGDSVYEWCQVPREIYNGWRTASSKGRFFNQSVKGAWDC